MRTLVDTHILIWALDDPAKLSGLAATVIQEPTNDLSISAATVWEMAIKVGQGNLTLSLPYRQWMTRAITDLELTILPVTVDYADRQATLPPHHKDPFDRFMIAQALVDGISIVSADAIFDLYGVIRVW